MAKKRLLIIFAVLLVLALLVVLGSTVFTLQNAKIFFITYNSDTKATEYYDAPQKYESISEESLIGDFKGKNMFFFSSKQLSDTIQQTYPTLSVVSIQRLFSNKIEIFVEERTPVAYVAAGGYYYLVDADLFVMESATLPYAGYIAIDFGSELSITQTVGKTLVFDTDDELSTSVTAVLNSLWQHFYEYVQMPNLLKSISVDSYKDCKSIVLHTKTGADIWIVSALTETTNKLSGGLGAYNSDLDGDLTGEGITIYCFDPDSNTVVVKKN